MPEDDKKREQPGGRKTPIWPLSGALDKQLSAQLQHYAEQRHHGVINSALQTIISKFFN